MPGQTNLMAVVEFGGAPANFCRTSTGKRRFAENARASGVKGASVASNADVSAGRA